MSNCKKFKKLYIKFKIQWIKANLLIKKRLYLLNSIYKLNNQDRCSALNDEYKNIRN